MPVSRAICDMPMARATSPSATAIIVGSPSVSSHIARRYAARSWGAPRYSVMSNGLNASRRVIVATPLAQNFLGTADVRRLRALVAAGEQDHQRVALAGEE